MKNEYSNNYFITENYENEYSDEMEEFDDCIPTFQCKLLHENDTIESSIIVYNNNKNNNNNNDNNNNLNSNCVDDEESVLGHLTNISLLSAFHCSPSLYV